MSTRGKNFYLLPIALAFAAMFGACATRVAGLKQSDTFKFPSIVTGHLAIGGVTSVMEDLPESRRNSFGNLLRTRLIEERKEFPVIPAGALANKLGATKYNELLSQYKNTGLLSETWLQTLKQKFEGNRYVAFARIENEDVAHDRRETDRTNERGQVIAGEGTVTTSATRTITASLSIYDLQSGEVAWSGEVTKSLNATKDYQREHEANLISVIKAIKGTETQTDEAKYPYPAAPDTNRVLAAVFSGFAENMPKKD